MRGTKAESLKGSLIGGVKIGNNVESVPIVYSSRISLDTVIGDGTKLDALVHLPIMWL